MRELGDSSKNYLGSPGQWQTWTKIYILWCSFHYATWILRFREHTSLFIDTSLFSVIISSEATAGDFHECFQTSNLAFAVRSACNGFHVLKGSFSFVSPISWEHHSLMNSSQEPYSEGDSEQCSPWQLLKVTEKTVKTGERCVQWGEKAILHICSVGELRKGHHPKKGRKLNCWKEREHFGWTFMKEARTWTASRIKAMQCGWSERSNRWQASFQIRRVR